MKLTVYERPTGGLADAPSSKAVEEECHFGKILLLERADGKRLPIKPLKYKGTEIGKEILLDCFVSPTVDGSFPSYLAIFFNPLFPLSAVFQAFWVIPPLLQKLLSLSSLTFLSGRRSDTRHVAESHKGKTLQRSRICGPYFPFLLWKRNPPPG